MEIHDSSVKKRRFCIFQVWNLMIQNAGVAPDAYALNSYLGAE